ncbi:MAG: DUF4160 domain-containing protein [Defluviitaleaceae bacterium]|nr:DUF4160 domain-containing protein [Defluviitaleaceae bacterium]
MPTLSMFYGIIVRMFNEKGGKHHLPHVHAMYSGKEVVVTLDGNILEGKFPGKQMKLLLAWLEIHYEELVANWELLSGGETSFKIDPLK